MPIDPVTGARKRGRPSKAEKQAEAQQQQLSLERKPGSTFELPGGRTVECHTPDEAESVARDAAPYLERSDKIPSDYWPIIHMLLENHLQLRRLVERIAQLQAPGVQADPKVVVELLKQQDRLQDRIAQTSLKLDPLKRDESGDANPHEILAEYLTELRAYMKDHIGEFQWQCPQCGGQNICEVPHFAFDPTWGPKAIWNADVYEQVRRYYLWRQRLESAVRFAPPPIRKYLLDPNTDLARVLKEAGGLSVIEAANVLKISPIGLLATGKLDHDFDFGFEFDLDKMETLFPYILSEEEMAIWRVSPPAVPTEE